MKSIDNQEKSADQFNLALVVTDSSKATPRLYERAPQHAVSTLKWLGLLVGLSVSSTAFTASPALATKPLTVSGGVVKPNLMYIFDGSESMKKDLANDTLTDWGQCKAADKDQNKQATVTGLTIGPTVAYPSKPNTRLTIFASNYSKNVNNLIYLTVPGKPTLSGVYKIKVKNTTSTGCVTGSQVYNSTAIVNDPYKYNEITAELNAPVKKNPITAAINNPTPVGQSGYQNGDPGIKGCSVTTSQPANVVNLTSDVNKGGGFVVDRFGVTSTPSASCYWKDPKDKTGCSVTTSAPANVVNLTSDVNKGGGFLVNPDGTVTGTADNRCYWNDPKDKTGCKVVTSQPANNGNTSSNSNLGGGVLVQPDGTVTATADSRCYWVDPLDNAAGTVYQGCTNGTTGENSYEVDIAADTPATYTGTDSEVTDAAIVNYADDSYCKNPTVGSITLGAEPPMRAAKINTLAYDPAVSYRPPPWPKKVGLGFQAPKETDLAKLNTPDTAHNLLPSMDATYTSDWRLVRLDGTKLTAAGDPDTSAANTWKGATNSTSNVGLASTSNGMGFNRWPEMVFCDTADRPAIFTNNRDWLESSRCSRNIPGANTVLQSPNWPYKYPANTSGLTNTPNKTNWQSPMAEHQNGQSKGTKNPIFDFGGGAYNVFGEYYNYAVPYYYNITPIEYCTSSDLKTCNVQSAADGAYPVPSYVRYCKTRAQSTDTQNAQSGNCQALYTGNVENTDYKFARYGLFEKIEVKSSVMSYAKSSDRKDCAGATCTYAEEMTNIANWFAYYRTRMQLMKSASGRVFDTLNADNDADADYRVGFITVEGYREIAGNYLPINDFKGGTNAQKEQWFKSVYGQIPTGGTALRDVLGTVGRIYAGKHPVTGFSNDDPVQYSCQQNFTLLTTDGYWNGDTGLKPDGSTVGNQDVDPEPYPIREGVSVADTLADVALYYYNTDLRNQAAFSNCTGALGSDVCLNDVLASGEDENKKQHMTTFTLGLGVDGQFNYSPTYKTDATGDFADLKTGFQKWPEPGPDDGNAIFTAKERATIDDLWHAAVNGHGTYFSAKNPEDLVKGLSGTLTALKDAPGTGSTTALSSNLVTSTEYAYSARFITGKWTGNLFARTINASGVLSTSAVWCVENEGSVSPPCSGSLLGRVSASSDTRNIKMNNGAGALVDFNTTNISTAGKMAYFNNAKLHSLTQWIDNDYTAYQQANLNETTFVGYLRGQKGFDKRDDNDLGLAGDNRLYRERSAVLGDIVDSDPIFVGKPAFEYNDPGYKNSGGFVDHTYSALRTVYVGANDGMLHAFNADTGEERWAFVPTAVMPNLWKLADKNYSNLHTNYVNAKFTVADVFIGGAWETILVSGLGQGGQSYFAIKITDPNHPVLLWEVDSSQTNFSNLGYTYGKPVVTKLLDGTWVVALPSGYNNTAQGDGGGHLYVVDALSGGGNVYKDISTGAGNSITPSGLAQVSGFAQNPMTDNTATYVYGGDLLGNVWRFDINAGSVTKLTTLKNATGDLQPVTTTPNSATIEGKRVIYIGTGKFIEPEDLLPENYETQTIYAIKDDDISTAVADIRAVSVEQTLTTDGTSRTASNNEVKWTDPAVLGWYVDLANGERQNSASAIIGGVFIVPTLVPPVGLCDQSGKGWINVFDYKTGGAVDPAKSYVVSTQTSSPIAGLYYTYATPVPGDPLIITVGADFSKATIKNNDCDSSAPNCNKVEIPAGGKFQSKRAIWRELITE